MESSKTGIRYVSPSTLPSKTGIRYVSPSTLPSKTGFRYVVNPSTFPTLSTPIPPLPTPQLNFVPMNMDLFEDTILLLTKLKTIIHDGQQEINKEDTLKGILNSLTNELNGAEMELVVLTEKTEKTKQQLKVILDGDYMTYSPHQLLEIQASLSLALQNLGYLQNSRDVIKYSTKSPKLQKPGSVVQTAAQAVDNHLQEKIPLSQESQRNSPSDPNEIVSQLSGNIATITNTFKLISEKMLTLKTNMEKLESDISLTKSSILKVNFIISIRESQLQLLQKQLTIFDKLCSLNFTKEEVIELLSKVSTAMRNVSMAEAVQLLKSQQLTSNDDTLCIVCYERARNIRFSPCGHGITCDICCSVLTKCPYCRQPVENKSFFFRY